MENENKSLVEQATEYIDETSAKAHYKKAMRGGKGRGFVVSTPIDKNRYPNREKEGLEGPYKSRKSGKIFYYDKKEGKYYDPDSDMYLQVSDVMEHVDPENPEYDPEMGQMNIGETNELDEGPATQNPLVTAYGGLKAAQKTDSYKKYFKRLEKERAERAAKQAKKKNEEVEQVDEKETTYLDKKRNKRNPARDMRKAPDGSPTDGYYAKGDGSHGRRQPSKYSAQGRRRSVNPKYGDLQRRYEDVEQVDELDAKTLIRYNNKASAQVTRDLKTDQGKHTPKTNQRMKGVLKARKKLDKIMPGLRQEAQVDELSAKTLKKYSSKARQDHSDIVQKGYDPMTGKLKPGFETRRQKRKAGFTKAMNRLTTKEELSDEDAKRMGIDQPLKGKGFPYNEDVEQVTEKFEMEFADKETAQKFMSQIVRLRLGSATGTKDGKVTVHGPQQAGVGSPTKAHQQMSKIMKKFGGKIISTDEGPRMKKVFEAPKIKVKLNPEKKIGYKIQSVGPGGKKITTKMKDWPGKKDIG